MIYDITNPTPPDMPTLGKGLETQRLLLSQTSKDMFQPEHPMLYAPLGSKISGAEFQYPSGQWLEPCGQIRLLCADSGNNKGQHSLLVEAIMHEELRSDHEEIKKYLEWQKTCKAANKRDKPIEQDLCIHVMPSDTTRPGYLKAQMAAEKHGGYTTLPMMTSGAESTIRRSSRKKRPRAYSSSIAALICSTASFSLRISKRFFSTLL